MCTSKKETSAQLAGLKGFMNGEHRSSQRCTAISAPMRQSGMVKGTSPYSTRSDDVSPQELANCSFIVVVLITSKSGLKLGRNHEKQDSIQLEKSSSSVEQSSRIATELLRDTGRQAATHPHRFSSIQSALATPFPLMVANISSGNLCQGDPIRSTQPAWSTSIISSQATTLSFPRKTYLPIPNFLPAPSHINSFMDLSPLPCNSTAASCSGSHSPLGTLRSVHQKVISIKSAEVSDMYIEGRTPHVPEQPWLMMAWVRLLKARTRMNLMSCMSLV